MTVTLDELLLSNGVRQFDVSGVLDSATFFETGDQLYDTVTGQGGTVLMNLTDLEYVSSAGMRLFVRCAKSLAETGGELHLAAPQPRVMSVLTIGGFVPTFPVYQTLDEGLAAIGG